MVDRNVELIRFKQWIGGYCSKEATIEWDEADNNGDFRGKSVALKNKAKFLIFQNPYSHSCSSDRLMKDLQLSTEYFWAVPSQKD